MKTSIENLESNVKLRELLKNYCTIQYELGAELDDFHLMQEYYLLLKENRLNDLFECEKLNSH